MAAGLSVITTDKGAVADFTSNDTVWQVKSKLVDCMQYPCDNGKASVFGLPTGNMPQWLNYSTSDLGEVMRSVRDQPSLANAKAKAAQRCVMTPSICQHFDHTASCCIRRTLPLVQSQSECEEDKIFTSLDPLTTLLSSHPSVFHGWEPRYFCFCVHSTAVLFFNHAERSMCRHCCCADA
jgi:hypothetical protein